MPLLKAIDAFVIEDVRIGATESRRLVDAVVHDDELPLRRVRSRLLEKLLKQLVVAVHEIYLEAFRAHRAVAIEHPQALLPVHQLRPGRPEDHVHALLLRIRDHVRHVHVGARLVEVELLRPSLVHDDVGDAVRRREVDVLLVRLEVAARLEAGHVRDLEPVPPVPRDLSRLHPRGVGHAARLGERVDGVGRNEIGGTVPDHEHAPREHARPLRLREVMMALLHVRHAAADVKLAWNAGLP